MEICRFKFGAWAVDVSPQAANWYTMKSQLQNHKESYYLL